jgi:hypothetical protein
LKTEPKVFPIVATKSNIRGESCKVRSYKKSASLPRGNRVADIKAEIKSARYSI